MLLIVMFETGTWRLNPDQKFTFGCASSCTAVLPNEDRGVSRNAGSFEWRAGKLVADETRVTRKPGRRTNG